MSTIEYVVDRNQKAAGGARHALILAVLAIAGTTFALLQAVVVPALPSIQHALGASSSGAAWILTANLLSTAVLTPILGRAGPGTSWAKTASSARRWSRWPPGR
jgi:predicted MFS family arabinose efflux permease